MSEFDETTHHAGAIIDSLAALLWQTGEPLARSLSEKLYEALREWEQEADDE